MMDKKELKDEELNSTTAGYTPKPEPVINKPAPHDIHINGLEIIGPYAVGTESNEKDL